MSEYIYLDNNSTTKIDPRVLEAMMPYLQDLYANAASNHGFGTLVNQKVKEARKQVADLIGSEPNEIIFTSGATEAINLAIKGVAEYYSSKGKHIITLQTEHSAVLDVCKYLETKGIEVTYLPVKSDGLLDVKMLEDAIRRDTILVSIMYVNNEIGIIQPIKEIAEIAHNSEAIFMTDATQAVGKITVNVNELGIDLMSFSAHKFYGPKGIGALFVRSRGAHKVKPAPLLHGGGHERGIRSGTLNVPNIIGLGKACEIANGEMNENAIRIMELRDKLEKELLKVDGSKINGSKTHRLYNIINIRFEGIDADALITGMKNIYISTGSACTSASIEPSHVLKSLGLTSKESYSSIRISLSKYNTHNEITIFSNGIREQINLLRKL